MTAINVTSRVQKHRTALRKSGLRPVQIWVPDTRHPHFSEECRQQSLLAAKSEYADPVIDQLMDDALTDVDGWAK